MIQSSLLKKRTACLFFFLIFSFLTYSRLQSDEFVSLYQIAQTDQTEEIIRAYSKYKYGDCETIKKFANELISTINSSYGEAIRTNQQEWAIVIPPYGTIAASVYPLAQNIANQLGLRLITTHAGKGDRSEPYATLKTKEERRQARSTINIHLGKDVSLKGLKLLLIDDLVTTGSTINHLKNLLIQTYLVKEVHVFTIAQLRTENPAYEEQINTYLLNDVDPKPLIEVLSNHNTTINRHSLKSILNLEENRFKTMLNLFPNNVLSKLLINAELYHEGHLQKDNVTAHYIQLLFDKIVSNSHLQRFAVEKEISTRFSTLPGRSIVLFGGGSASGKTTKAKFYEQTSINGKRFVRISMDAYLLREKSYHGVPDVDHIDSLDKQRLWLDIQNLLDGNEVLIPPVNKNKTPRRVYLGLEDILIIEGLHALHPLFLQGLPDNQIGLKVFFDSPWQLRFMRRMLRYTNNPVRALNYLCNALEREKEFVIPTKSNCEFVYSSGSKEEVQKLAPRTQEFLARIRDQEPDLRLNKFVDDVHSFIASYAQESMPTQTHRIFQFENEYVRVWKTIIMPHQPLSMHHHDYARVVVGLKGGTLKKIEENGETSDLNFETGVAYWLTEDPPGTLHGDINESDEPIEVMIIEFKSPSQNLK